MGYFDVDVPEPAVISEPDEDVAYGMFKQKLLDEDREIMYLTNGKGLPDGDDYELRKLEMRA